jgi:hypothetical protein
LLTGSTVSAIGGDPTSGENVEYGIVLAMHVLVLALQGAFDLGLSALLDTLGTANELASAMDAPTAAIDVTLVGVRRRVHTAQGFRVPLVATAITRHADAVLLPALGEKTPSTLAERLTHSDVADAGGVLREWSHGNARQQAEQQKYPAEELDARYERRENVGRRDMPTSEILDHRR